MSAPLHTPGPWKIFKGHTGLTWFIVFKTREHRQRTECANVFKGPRLVSTDGVTENALASIDSMSLNHQANKDANLAEGRANAYLIAAAPQMLVALKQALHWFEYQGERFDDQKIDHDTFEIIQSAILDAEGKI